MNTSKGVLSHKQRPVRHKVLPFDRDRGTDGQPNPGASEESSKGGSSLPIRTSRLAVLLLLTTVSMMFVAFTSTYVARMGGVGWIETPIPTILWGTTAIILVSSGTLAWAKRALKADQRSAAQLGLGLTLALGALFVGGQWLAWQELIAHGVFLQESAHVAFFYLLTAVHALHVIGGVIALAVTLLRNARERDQDAAYNRLDNTALYWHFVDGLWVYVFLLLFFT